MRKHWRGTFHALTNGARTDWYVVAPDEQTAESRFRGRFPALDRNKLHVVLVEEHGYPLPACDHPDRYLVFWQYGKETENRPRTLVRCYLCLGCGCTVHDDDPHGRMKLCGHAAHRPLPGDDKVH